MGKFENYIFDEKCESWDMNLDINDVLRDSPRQSVASQDFPGDLLQESNKIQKIDDDENNVMIILMILMTDQILENPGPGVSPNMNPNVDVRIPEQTLFGEVATAQFGTNGIIKIRRDDAAAEIPGCNNATTDTADFPPLRPCQRQTLEAHSISQFQCPRVTLEAHSIAQFQSPRVSLEAHSISQFQCSDKQSTFM